MSTDNTHRLPHGEIMVVEDDAVSLKLLSEISTKAGYQVRAASDGELALRSVRAKLPDLILLDIQMPGMNGIEVCRRLKADPETRDLPVIFISAMDETDSKVKALEAGGTDYITKPIHPPEVLARIHTHLNMYRLQRKLAFQAEELIAEIEERKQVEGALQKSQRQLATLMDNLPGMAYRCKNDRDWTMEFVSCGCQSLTGFRPEELIGNKRVPYADLIHPEDRQAVWDSVREAVEEKRSFQITYRITASNGEEKWVWEQGQSVSDANSDVTALEGFITEITERKRAEAELDKYREHLEALVCERTVELAELSAEQQLILDSVRAMIWYKDTENNVLRVNKAAAESVGLSVEEIIGKSTEELFPQEAAKYYQDDLEVIQSGQPKLGIVELMRTPSGDVLWLLTDKIPIADETGAVTSLIAFAIDITERKQAQEKAERRTEELRSIVNSMAGRENRMVGLQETIKKLRAQIERAGMTPVADDPIKERPSWKSGE